MIVFDFSILTNRFISYKWLMVFIEIVDSHYIDVIVIQSTITRNRGQAYNDMIG